MYMRMRRVILPVLAVGCAVFMAAGCQSKDETAAAVPPGTQTKTQTSQAKIPDGMTGTPADTFVKPGGK